MSFDLARNQFDEEKGKNWKERRGKIGRREERKLEGGKRENGGKEKYTE